MKKNQSILYYLFFSITGLVFFFPISVVIWLLTVLFDKRLYILHLYTQIWESFLLFIIPNWKINIIGKEKIDDSKPVVFISNHQSEFDIMVISHLYAHFKWVSKAEVFKSPILGWNMRMNQYIELKRGDRKSIMKMIKDCISNLQKDSSVFIFPEGTRSKTGILRSFSSGAVVIAQKAKVGIQPIAISGTKDIMIKGSWILNFSADVSIIVLDEIPYNEIKNKDASDISKMLRQKIAEHVKEHH